MSSLIVTPVIYATNMRASLSLRRGGPTILAPKANKNTGLLKKLGPYLPKFYSCGFKLK
ncbi:hypothetical protein HanRHA438_Chr12g0574291 [Helianthus annuus]|nr:hypothetical protein HanRHA438_Chr12g0574291 [Helianthus annuus]